MELLFFDFGSGEIFLIVLAIFLVFGPEKIPELARNLGKFINEMKRATEDIKTEINREAEKKEREKKLAEYKKRMEEQKKGDKTDRSPADTIPESETVSTREDKVSNEKTSSRDEQPTGETEKTEKKEPSLKDRIQGPDASVPKGQ